MKLLLSHWNNRFEARPWIADDGKSSTSLHIPPLDGASDTQAKIRLPQQHLKL